MPVNFLLHLTTNFFTKFADELASAKVLFPWVLSLLGAPLVLISLCVPIREAGVLIPQLFVAAKIRAKKYRKYVWMLGSLLTSVALGLCGLALFLDSSPEAATSLIFVGLLIFALSRGICSVAAKDVLGKTVSKMRRGTLTGLATSLSGVLTVIVGFNLGFYNEIKSSQLVLAGLFFLAGLCWLIATVSIWNIQEQAGATDGGANGFSAALRSVSLLWTDALFFKFVLVRTLMLGVALGLPSVVILIQQQSESLLDIGLLIVATGVANTVSGYFWGRLADKSAVTLLALCSGIQVLAAAIVFSSMYLMSNPMQLGNVYLGIYFLLCVALAGVRTGRKTLLVDIATGENRSSYVAVSNTVIGLMILISGAVVGWFAGQNATVMFLIYSLMAGLAGIFAVMLLRGTQHA